MSTMTFIRHGQASFGDADYDRLSNLGEEQARLLGEYWRRGGCRFDQVFTGPRLRQKRTAEIIGQSFSSDSAPWPTPIEVSDFDEYDLHGFVTRLAPALAERDPHFANLCATYQRSQDHQERIRTFQIMFERLLVAWQDNILPMDGVESWKSFQQRLKRAIQTIQTNAARGSRIAIVSSGGFIGSAVGWVLAASDRAALEMNWRVRNCSLTEFVFTRDRMSLEYFNALPHLPDSSYWTFR